MIAIAAIEKRERERIEQRRAEAKFHAGKIASMLKEKYGVTKVIFFGSIISSPYLSERSDIDLLVYGLSPQDIIPAGADAWKFSGRFDVDLVPAEAAGRGIVSKAEKEGVLL